MLLGETVTGENRSRWCSSWSRTDGSSVPGRWCTMWTFLNLFLKQNSEIKLAVLSTENYQLTEHALFPRHQCAVSHCEVGIVSNRQWATNTICSRDSKHLAASSEYDIVGWRGHCHNSDIEFNYVRKDRTISNLYHWNTITEHPYYTIKPFHCNCIQ